MAEHFSVALPATAIFDYPSPVALAAFVATLLDDNIPLSLPVDLASAGLRPDDRPAIGIRAVCSKFPGDGQGSTRSRNAFQGLSSASSETPHDQQTVTIYALTPFCLNLTNANVSYLPKH